MEENVKYCVILGVVLGKRCKSCDYNATRKKEHNRNANIEKCTEKPQSFQNECGICGMFENKI